MLLLAAVMVRLLLLLLPEVGRKLLHVLVADGALLLLLLALGEQLLQLGVQLLLLGLRRLLVAVWRLRRRLVGAQDGVSAAALLLLLELLHLLLELQVRGEGHLVQRGRVGRLLLLLLLLLRRLRCPYSVATLQYRPALRLGHLRHLLLARVRLLQVPRNVTAGHATAAGLAMSAARWPLLLLLLRWLLLLWRHLWHSDRVRKTAHPRMLMGVWNLRWRALLRRRTGRSRRRRRMLSHEGAQVAL